MYLNEYFSPEQMPVIMMSGHGTVETAVEATRLGAYDFLEKPLSLAYQIMGNKTTRFTPLFQDLEETLQKSGLRINLPKHYVY